MSLFRKTRSAPEYPGLTADQKRLADLILDAKVNGIITPLDAQRAFARQLGLYIVG